MTLPRRRSGMPRVRFLAVSVLGKIYRFGAKEVSTEIERQT
jgi:hypothetical protein